MRETIDSRRLTQCRFDSYRKLERENAWMAVRSDKRLRAECAKAWRAIRKQQRQRGSRR